MSQIFKENIPLLTKLTGTTLSLAATYEGKSGRVTVGGRQYPVSAAIVLNTAVTGVNGLDTGALASNTLYYIYAVRNSSTAGLGIVASTAAPSVGPTGFTGWKEIGRFRTFFGSAAIGIVVNRLEGDNVKSSSTGEESTYTLPITSSGSQPTKGTTTVDIAKYRYIGTKMEVRYTYTQTVAGVAGTGTYFFGVPTGFSVDTSEMSLSQNGNTVGNFSSNATTPGAAGSVQVNNATTLYLTDNAQGAISATTWALSTAARNLSFQALLPIRELVGLWA